MSVANCLCGGDRQARQGFVSGSARVSFYASAAQANSAILGLGILGSGGVQSWRGFRYLPKPKGFSARFPTTQHNKLGLVGSGWAFSSVSREVWGVCSNGQAGLRAFAFLGWRCVDRERKGKGCAMWSEKGLASRSGRDG